MIENVGRPTLWITFTGIGITVTKYRYYSDQVSASQ